MFKYDNKFNRIMTVVFDFIMLNAIFLVLSIPIVTIGANVSALYSVSFQFINKNESSLFKTYFKSFKENFKQATIAWCTILAIFLILFGNLKLLGQGISMNPIITILTILFLLVMYIVCLYIFPLISKFENTLYVHLKNVLLLSIGYLPHTILLLLVNLGPLYAVYKWLGTHYSLFIYGYFFIGIVLVTVVNAFIFKQIFNKMLKSKQILT
ncbi:YesL family protein [Fundicoccus sp. Sow4_H7]|uniref:YesL family protein n=1 Tax=Fundicoccus sp. Sow4_H7 TaxID=3438784 RepID=UPI003F8F6A54